MGGGGPLFPKTGSNLKFLYHPIIDWVGLRVCASLWQPKKVENVSRMVELAEAVKDWTFALSANVSNVMLQKSSTASGARLV